MPFDEAGFGHAAFGNATVLKEKSHMTWGWSMLESLLAGHTLRRARHAAHPGLTFVALLSLALGNRREYGNFHFHGSG